MDPDVLFLHGFQLIITSQHLPTDAILSLSLPSLLCAKARRQADGPGWCWTEPCRPFCLTATWPSAGRHDIISLWLLRMFTQSDGCYLVLEPSLQVRALLRQHYCIYTWECVTSFLLCELLITGEKQMWKLPWPWINPTCFYTCPSCTLIQVKIHIS